MDSGKVESWMNQVSDYLKSILKEQTHLQVAQGRLAEQVDSMQSSILTLNQILQSMVGNVPSLPDHREGKYSPGVEKQLSRVQTSSKLKGDDIPQSSCSPQVLHPHRDTFLNQPSGLHQNDLLSAMDVKFSEMINEISRLMEIQRLNLRGEQLGAQQQTLAPLSKHHSVAEGDINDLPSSHRAPSGTEDMKYEKISGITEMRLPQKSDISLSETANRSLENILRTELKSDFANVCENLKTSVSARTRTELVWLDHKVDEKLSKFMVDIDEKIAQVIQKLDHVGNKREEKIKVDQDRYLDQVTEKIEGAVVRLSDDIETLKQAITNKQAGALVSDTENKATDFIQTSQSLTASLEQGKSFRLQAKAGGGDTGTLTQQSKLEEHTLVRKEIHTENGQDDNSHHPISQLSAVVEESSKMIQKRIAKTENALTESIARATLILKSELKAPTETTNQMKVSVDNILANQINITDEIVQQCVEGVEDCKCKIQSTDEKLYRTKLEIFHMVEKEAQLLRDQMDRTWRTPRKIYTCDFFVEKFRDVVSQPNSFHSYPWYIDQLRSSVQGMVAFLPKSQMRVSLVFGRHPLEVGLRAQSGVTLSVTARIKDTSGSQTPLEDFPVGRGRRLCDENNIADNDDWGLHIGVVNCQELIGKGFGLQEGYKRAAILIRYEIEVV